MVVFKCFQFLALLLADLLGISWQCLQVVRHNKLTRHCLHACLGALPIDFTLGLCILRLHGFCHAKVVERHCEPALGHLLISKLRRIKAHQVLVLQLSKVTRVEHSLLVLYCSRNLLLYDTQLPKTTFGVHRKAFSAWKERFWCESLEYCDKAPLKCLLTGAAYPSNLDSLLALMDILDERGVPLIVGYTECLTNVADAF